MDYYYSYERKKEAAIEKPSKKEALFECIGAAVTALIAVVVIFLFFFRMVTIEGDSMLDTLHSGDRVIISNVLYTPKQGDIVVISRNADNSVEKESAEPIIKRVIAVEGQTVDIDFEEGIVYVDGVALKEDYTRTLTTVKYEDMIDFPAYVPENCIFVMGDNRNYSLDSRSEHIGDNGMIDVRYVLGKAVFRVFPQTGGLY